MARGLPAEGQTSRASITLLVTRPHSSRDWSVNYTCARGSRIICPRLRWLHHKYCKAEAACEINNGIGLIPRSCSPQVSSRFKQSPAGINRRGLRVQPEEAIRTRLSMEIFSATFLDVCWANRFSGKVFRAATTFACDRIPRNVKTAFIQPTIALCKQSYMDGHAHDPERSRAAL